LRHRHPGTAAAARRAGMASTWLMANPPLRYSGAQPMPCLPWAPGGTEPSGLLAFPGVRTGVVRTGRSWGCRCRPIGQARPGEDAGGPAGG
jgi:hypothetical protein